jgi:hypothetical protein
MNPIVCEPALLGNIYVRIKSFDEDEIEADIANNRRRLSAAMPSDFWEHKHSRDSFHVFTGRPAVQAAEQILCTQLMLTTVCASAVNYAPVRLRLRMERIGIAPQL